MAEHQTAFGALLAALPAEGTGIAVSERTTRGVATVMARAGQAAAIGRRLGFAVTDGPVLSASPEAVLLGTGPGAWLMIVETFTPGWATAVADDLAGFASVFDQSSGYAILRLSGVRAGALLQKGAFLDLHMDAFPPGSVAVTVIEHIGAILWRSEENVFEIAVFRSFASSFWHWLAAAAAATDLALHRAD